MILGNNMMALIRKLDTLMQLRLIAAVLLVHKDINPHSSHPNVTFENEGHNYIFLAILAREEKSLSLIYWNP